MRNFCRAIMALTFMSASAAPALANPGSVEIDQAIATLFEVPASALPALVPDVDDDHAIDRSADLTDGKIWVLGVTESRNWLNSGGPDCRLFQRVVSLQPSPAGAQRYRDEFLTACRKGSGPVETIHTTAGEPYELAPAK